MSRVCDLLASVKSGAAGTPGTIVILAAHPDDEVIGAGAQLRDLVNPWVFYTTDGSPANPSFATEAGFATAEEYAAARSTEAVEALHLAGITPAHIRKLGFKDQDASYHLVELTHNICTVLHEIMPAVVLTHPYEGGHPDHDATAFAASAACLLLTPGGQSSPEILEYSSYHGCADGVAVSDFIPSAHDQVVTSCLSPEQRELKREMFAAYRSQRAVLSMFPIDVERFRRAPAYNFTTPPHVGKLYYENFDRGIDGERWRAQAGEALKSLGLARAP